MRYFFLFIVLIFTGCGLGDSLLDHFGNSELDIRGVLSITEVHYAGSVKTNFTGGVVASYPDDDFIELRSFYDGDIDISDWTIVIYGDQYHTVQIPAGTVLKKDQYFTLGNTNGLAFNNIDLQDPHIRLSSQGFAIKIYDGGGAKKADSLDFRDWPSIPGGIDLPTHKASVVRVTDYFGAKSGSNPLNWATYSSTRPEGVTLFYTVLASPGTKKGGVEGSGGEDQ